MLDSKVCMTMFVQILGPRCSYHEKCCRLWLLFEQQFATAGVLLSAAEAISAEQGSTCIGHHARGWLYF